MKNLAPMTMHHGRCHRSRALCEVSCRACSCKKDPCWQIVIVNEVFDYFEYQIIFASLFAFISVWICKNVATEISLIYPLTEARIGAVFFFRSYFVFI